MHSACILFQRPDTGKHSNLPAVSPGYARSCLFDCKFLARRYIWPQSHTSSTAARIANQAPQSTASLHAERSSRRRADCPPHCPVSEPCPASAQRFCRRSVQSCSERTPGCVFAPIDTDRAPPEKIHLTHTGLGCESFLEILIHRDIILVPPESKEALAGKSRLSVFFRK